MWSAYNYYKVHNKCTPYFFQRSSYFAAILTCLWEVFVDSFIFVVWTQFICMLQIGQWWLMPRLGSSYQILDSTVVMLPAQTVISRFSHLRDVYLSMSLVSSCITVQKGYRECTCNSYVRTICYILVCISTVPSGPGSSALLRMSLPEISRLDMLLDLGEDFFLMALQDFVSHEEFVINTLFFYTWLFL